MGVGYLKRQFMEGEVVTTDLLAELYLFEQAPLERMISEAIGTPDSIRRSHFKHPGFWTVYTLNGGLDCVDLLYEDFGRTDSCEISINIMMDELNGMLLHKMIREEELHPCPAPTARGGIVLQYAGGTIIKGTYWTQFHKQERRLDSSLDFAGAYHFLKEECEKERANVLRRHIDDCVIDAILESAKGEH
jgi:hypothetical protein